MQFIKYIVLALVLGVVVLTAYATFEHFSESDEVDEVKKEQKSKKTTSLAPKKATPVNVKKERYFSLVNPHVQNVYAELMEQYEDVKVTLEKGESTQEIERLKKEYEVTTDDELLLALKPHPQSIVLAQGAMESSWGTSRFFVEANNIFGMWSANPNEPRIAAGEQRSGGRTIWLRKFANLDESVREYYKTMARVDVYKEFRRVRYESDNPFEMIKKLDKYAEIGEEYPKKLAQLIRYNKLQKYDK